MFTFIRKVFGLPQKTIVEIRRHATPMIYATRNVYYDAWSEPYVHFGEYMDFECKLLDEGRVADGPYTTEWKLKSGPPVVFSNKDPSSGWKPEYRCPFCYPDEEH
jgi:hypothetical protein